MKPSSISLVVNEGSVNPGELFLELIDFTNSRVIQHAGLSRIRTLSWHKSIHAHFVVVLFPLLKGFGVITNGLAAWECQVVFGNPAVIRGFGGVGKYALDDRSNQGKSEVCRLNGGLRD